MSSSKTPVTLNPIAGFCVKSSTLQSGSYTPSNHPIPSANPSLNTLEILTQNLPIAVNKGLKVFINVAWDKNVPPPPDGSEDAIQRAMMGEDVDELNPDGWYVPVVVSEGRQDKDKVGNPCLVFDCIYNSSIKSRALKDPEFKIFLIELALQRIESQTQIFLSRQIGTPNLASKGKLEPRTVFIPSALYPYGPANVSLHSDTSLIRELSPPSPTPTPLIQEVTSQPTSIGDLEPIPKTKGILKNTQHVKSPTHAAAAPGSAPTKPAWSWSTDEHQNKIRVVICVPGVTRAQILQSTLDLEPRRLILHIPPLYSLDINLDLSDAEIVAISSSPSASISDVTSGNGSSDTNDKREGSTEFNALTLKRQRDLDVDGAQAEWRVAEGVLVVIA